MRGTKNLMIEIKSQIEDVNYEDVTKKEEKKSRLTDPHNRPANPMQESDNAEDRFEEDEGFNDDEMF